MAKQQKKVPAKALYLTSPDQIAAVSFLGEGENRKAQLNMTIYSGGIVRNHWYWDDLVLDLGGVNFPKKKYPILENHDRGKKIAFHNGKLLTDGSLRVDPNKTEFVSTPESVEFQRLSAEGFPYEASVRFNPTVIERIAKDAFGEANGVKLKGPATIIRKWEFVEGSVCVFGFDRNTQSSAFSDKQIELECEICGDGPRGFKLNQTQEGIIPMKLKELKLEYPDLVKQIQDEAVASAQPPDTSQLEAQMQTLTDQVTALSNETQSQAETIAMLKNENMTLAKKDVLRTESERKAKANGIWATKLKASAVSEHLFAKVQGYITHDRFVDTESGKCDWTKFSEAVDAEITDWETQLSKLDPSVAGGGYQQRTPDGMDTQLVADDDAFVDEMLELSGEKEGGDA